MNPDAALEERFAEAVDGKRVALVHDWLTGMRGGEKVLMAIADLFPTAPIYTLFAFPEALDPRLREHEIVTSRLQRAIPKRLLARAYRYALPLFPAAIEGFDLQEFDLVISTSHCVAKGVVPAPHARHLSYCHSPMRYAWDLEHQYFPARGGPLAAVRAGLLSRLRTWDVASCPRVDHFFANSRFVAQRIRRFYDRDAEVLHPPIAFEEPANAGPADDASSEPPFALAVSALVPYKRVELAIEACRRRGLALRVVGSGPEAQRLERVAAGAPGIELLGRVDDATLDQLFRRASFFVQPGVEDFGMAAVEALAAGTPVVAIGRGGVRDIVEDGVHGVLYEGLDSASLEAAIDRAMRIRFNSEVLTARAREFSPDRFDRQLREAIVRQLTADLPSPQDAPFPVTRSESSDDS